MNVLTRVALLLTAAAYLAVGVTCLGWTRAAADSLGMDLRTATAVTDFRATYGGMCLGFGVFFGWCAASRSAPVPGLWAMTLSFAGLAAARAAGLVGSTDPQPLMVKFLFAEILGAMMGAALLWWKRRLAGTA